MAIATDSYINVLDNNSQVVDRIGLSKTLDEYSVEDLISYAYCSNTDKLVKDIRDGTYAGSDVTGVGFTQMNGGIPCLWTHVTNPNYWMLKTEKVENPAQNNPNGLYAVVVWLYGDNPNNSNPAYTALSGLKLITKWDAPHYLFDVSNASFYSTGAFGATNWNTPKSNAAWAIAGNTSVITYHTDFTSESDVSYNLPSSAGDKIKPYLLFMMGANTYIKSLLPVGNAENTSWKTAFTQFNSASNATCSKIYTDSDGLNAVGVNNALLDMYSDASMETLIPFPYKVRADNNGTNYGHDINGFKYTYLRQGTASPSRSVYISYFYSDVEDMKLYIANAGLHFKADKIYKPIINSGHVDNFTDVLTTPSEIDGWHDSTNHGITPTPPAPSGTDEDNTDPIPTAGAPYSSGLARYYATTAGSVILSHISQAMGAWNPKDSGKDLYKNIISCKLIKSPAAIPVSGSEPFTVYGVTLQYEGSDITLPVINDNPTASFGSYNIPRKFNDFRDYAPYTKVEIYLPYCGWTVLPSHVVGRSVSVKYYTDIIAATCKAVVYCNSNVIAEAAGVIGLDIPMVTENAGAKSEAVTMGLLAYGKAGLQTALGVGAAVATKGKAGVKQAVSGLSDVVSAYSQTAMAFNQNYTEINGKNGDGCCIAGISAIVIKITRPKYGANTIAPYVPSEYGHSTGFVSMKSAKVGSFTGLLVADNVDTSGISGATDREKQLIKLYLESGIYVNHPT